MNFPQNLMMTSKEFFTVLKKLLKTKILKNLVHQKQAQNCVRNLNIILIKMT